MIPGPRLVAGRACAKWSPIAPPALAAGRQIIISSRRHPRRPANARASTPASIAPGQANALPSSPRHPESVTFGSMVRVKDLNFGDEEAFTLVGRGEEDYEIRARFSSPAPWPKDW